VTPSRAAIDTRGKLIAHCLQIKKRREWRPLIAPALFGPMRTQIPTRQMGRERKKEDNRGGVEITAEKKEIGEVLARLMLRHMNCEELEIRVPPVGRRGCGTAKRQPRGGGKEERVHHSTSRDRK